MAFKDRADSLLRRATDSGDVPGVVAMLTDRKGTTYEGGFGKRVLGQSAGMSPDTVVWIASMSKALTSTAAMQLVERGRLELDAPASKWAPQLAQVKVLEGFDASGQGKLRAPKSQITLRHLLTHTAGFGYDIWSADLVRFQEKNGIPGIISCQNAALATPLLFDPGTRWFYGINIDWAGKMVEAASGVRLGAYLKENVFGPLGMNDTAFKISASMRQRLAKIHQRGEDGALAPQMELEIPQEPEFEMGGGGLYGTAGDYLKFVRMVLNGGRADGKQVLKPETVDQMCANNMGALRVQVLKTAMPGFSHDAEFFPGMPKSWGLAFQRNEANAPTGLPAGSLMWAGLANTFYWIDPSSGIGGVYLSQVLPFVDVKALPLFLEFQKAAYQ
jgi:CubicO group peptidase (beta-lactamase class C family)